MRPVMNDITSSRRARRFRVLSLAGWFHYWFILVAVLLVALVKGLVEPLVLEPAAERALQQASETIGQRLGKDVQIGFGDVRVSFGLKGMYLVVTNPSASVAGKSVSASEAALSLRPNELPILILREARIPIDVAADGSLLLAGVPIKDIEGLFDGSELSEATPNLPSSLLAVDAEVSFSFADGKRLDLPPVTAAVKPDELGQNLVMSIRSGVGDPLFFQGRIDIPLGRDRHGVNFYLNASGIENALLKLGIRTGIRSGNVQAWGSSDEDGTVELLAVASAEKMTYGFSLGTVDGPSGNKVTDSLLETDSLHLSARITASGLASESRNAAVEWAAAMDGISLQVPASILGTALSVDRFEANGEAQASETGVTLGASDMRVSGPVGTGSFDLALASDLDESYEVDLRGSGPIMDVSAVTGLLPLSLSERGVQFLRNDLQVASAQLLTIVVSGTEFSTFPWKDGKDGTFQMSTDFFNASLDYADGYPPLVEADGSFGLDGAALAVTVVSGKAGPAVLEVARAGVDDLDAAVSTLFVTLDSGLSDGALESLLLAMPETRKQAAPLLNDLRPAGEQSLRVALVINLDEDVPVQVDGILDLPQGNSVTHLPSGLALEDLAGSFSFTNDGVTGIGRGMALDTDVRLSVEVTDASRSLFMEGNFDITKTAARLGHELPVPLEGSSPISVHVGSSVILLESDLQGTAVRLPPPFGKEMDERSNSRLVIAGDTLRIEYGDGFVKTVSRIDADPIAISFGGGAPPDAPPASGIFLGGTIDGIDIDSLAGGMLGDTSNLGQDIKADLLLKNAGLLGLTHPELRLNATVAQTVTVATIESEAIKGMVSISGTTVAASLESLVFPDDEADPSDLGDDATIYIEPGVLTPELPPVSVRIDNLSIGSKRYHGVEIAGHPEQGTWVLDRLSAQVGDNELIASGSTNTEGAPRSDLTLKVLMPDLPGFFGNYSSEDSSESIHEGAGEIAGKIRWKGALNDPHLLSMMGNLQLKGQNIVISKDSSGARLLSLLSPFTILEALPNLSIGNDKTRFESALGNITIAEGDLVLEEVLLESPDLDLRLYGKTSLITERNQLHGTAVVKSSDNITTGAVSFVNPLAGALLLVFDKVLDAPLIGDLELHYDITGTWDEPVVKRSAGEGEG